MYTYPKKLVPFVAEGHKEKNPNYFEVVIDEKGNVFEANPSHQIALLIMAAILEDKEIEQISYECPPDYYADFDTWLRLKTKAICVWLEFYKGSPKDVQMKTLKELKEKELYLGSLESNLGF